MTAELEPDPAWVMDDTGFPKQGDHSVAVERQYSGTLGKTGNCQIAVSVHHVGEQGNAPLGLAAVLAGELGQRCRASARGGHSGRNRHSKKWELALEIIDQIREWGLPDRVVLGDAGYGDGTEFREELEKRELRYAVGVLPQVGVWLKPPRRFTPLKITGKGRPPTRPATGINGRPRRKRRLGKPKAGGRFAGAKGPRLVGVALLGDSRTTIPSVSGRQTAGQAGMVIGGVAGVGKDADQILPLRPSC